MKKGSVTMSLHRYMKAVTAAESNRSQRTNAEEQDYGTGSYGVLMRASSLPRGSQ